MSPAFEWLFAQYDGVPVHFIVLELASVVFALLSVWCSKRENILVYPTGIIATGIATYILLAWWGLLGDALINAYYFAMSIYGWWVWTRKVDGAHFIPVTVVRPDEKRKAAMLFLLTLLFVFAVYFFADRLDSWTAYVDMFTTGLFFVGMWLMAKKKLENWLFWIAGDIVSVPLYLYKGLVFSSFQFALFTVIAVYGYRAWKQNLGKSPQTLLK